MSGDLKRISIRNRRFDGTPSPEENSINVVVVGVAYVSRIFYEGAYDPARISAPTCWSADTEFPAEDVPEDQRQAGRCLDCVNNIRGSGRGQSRACRFVQRLAVTLEDDLETVYQLQLPPTSIFGDAISGDMPLRAYARYLDARETPIVAVITKIYFDPRSDIPKLFFRPLRPLEEQETETVKEMIKHPDTTTALKLSVLPMEDSGFSPFSEVEGFKFND
jgi:hypothetical protein|tara:strand:+ start:402 stop:1061 length:660 start_codon:yes stop_codon:yes gene_type:complete